jgi:hypothetical protein
MNSAARAWETALMAKVASIVLAIVLRILKIDFMTTVLFGGPAECCS